MSSRYAALRERLTQACYQHVTPHLEKYRAEPYLERCLPLMEPRLFHAFAEQACYDVTAVVLDVGRRQFRRYTRDLSPLPAALRELRVQDADEARLLEELSPCLGSFGGALSRYEPAFHRFRQMLAQRGQAALDSASYGLAAGEWVGSLLGGMAGVIASAAGSYFAGSAVDQQLQAEGERLQQAFTTMLGAFDEAMTVLTRSGLDILALHRQAMEAAIGSASR